MIRKHGFTLIESIIVIIVLGISMVTITGFLAPQVANSGIPQYQSRAAALGQSLMNQIIARDFDEHSDFNNGGLRCGDIGFVACSSPMDLGVDGIEITPASFNDVDDYIGCWYTSTTEAACISPVKYPLVNVLDENMEDSYANFRVEISVFYDSNMDGIDDGTIGSMKRVELEVFGGKNRYSIIAYKGNY